MRKLVIVLFSLLLLTGCAVEDISKKNTMDVVNETLEKEIKLYNNVFDGFKFYVPRGLKVTDKNKYNCKILNGKSIYYLYVDVISYHHKTKKEYEEKTNKYLSKEINYDGKFGYIEITEIDDKYYVEYMYNYSKIESYIEKEKLNKHILNMTYILSTMKYNDKVIETIVQDKNLNSKEEKIDIFESKSDKNSFLEALEKYDNYEEKEELKDSDMVDYESLE